MDIENGWYDVEISGGYTKQNYEVKDLKGNTIDSYSSEPTLEFKFILKSNKGEFKANINESFEF